MTIDEAIRDFATAEDTLPRDAMRWALDNWEVAGPRFIDLLDRYAAGTERTDETTDALFFVIHLLGEKRETAAFPALCRLLKEADAADRVLGDALTETFPHVIIAMYDGDRALLKDMIESTTVDEFVRGAALQAMAYLTRTGSFTDAEMRAYLLHLLAEMQPQYDYHVWTLWCLSVANLGYEDYASAVEKLIRRGSVPYRDMDMKDFRRQIRRTLDDPARMAGFENDRLRPFEDAIGTFSAWDSFTEQVRLDHARLAAEDDDEREPLYASDDVPYVNPHRHVGRNDPCPCGSGKKYKKCCLQ